MSGTIIPVRDPSSSLAQDYYSRGHVLVFIRIKTVLSGGK